VPKVNAYTHHDNGASVSLAVGERFELRLPENPKTEYRWRLTRCDLGVLGVSQEDFRRSPQQLDIGGEHRWRFTALRAGRCSVLVTFEPSRQRRGAPANFMLRVVVNELRPR